MHCFFNPRGIAVVGATPNPAKGGNAILKNLVTGFQGTICPVNPRYREIEGIPCVASVEDLPDDVKSISVITPPAVTEQVVRQAGSLNLVGIFLLQLQRLAFAPEVLKLPRLHGLADFLLGDALKTHHGTTNEARTAP